MVIVVGAGAAGLMAAIHAARAGERVLVLERTADGGRKILISGGGRCNVLPSELDPRRRDRVLGSIRPGQQVLMTSADSATLGSVPQSADWLKVERGRLAPTRST